VSLWDFLCFSRVDSICEFRLLPIPFLCASVFFSALISFPRPSAPPCFPAYSVLCPLSVVPLRKRTPWVPLHARDASTWRERHGVCAAKPGSLLALVNARTIRDTQTQRAGRIRSFAIGSRSTVADLPAHSAWQLKPITGTVATGYGRAHRGVAFRALSSPHRPDRSLLPGAAAIRALSRLLASNYSVKQSDNLALLLP
jgi:hypothetical protein